MEIITPRLRLREYRESDLHALHEMDANPETQRYEKGIPSVEETREYIRVAQIFAQEIPRTYFQLAVTIQPSDEVRGRVTIYPLNSTIREWEMGWAIHPQEWGKGYATEAAWHLMDFAFRELPVHRIVAFCHVANIASIRVMSKLGMQQDGRLRETRWWNGAWSDEFIYGILEREWKKIKPKE